MKNRVSDIKEAKVIRGVCEIKLLMVSRIGKGRA